MCAGVGVRDDNEGLVAVKQVPAAVRVGWGGIVKHTD